MVEQFVNGLSGFLQESYFLAYLAVYLGGVLVSFTPASIRSSPSPRPISEPGVAAPWPGIPPCGDLRPGDGRHLHDSRRRRFSLRQLFGRIQTNPGPIFSSETSVSL